MGSHCGPRDFHRTCPVPGDTFSMCSTSILLSWGAAKEAPRGKAPHARAQRVGLSGRIGPEIGVDAGAAFLIVTLGKRSPMPYVCSRAAWPAFCPASGYGCSDHGVVRKNGGSA